MPELFFRLLRYWSVAAFICIFGSWTARGQGTKSEKDMLKEGNKLFYEEKYSEATTYFVQLVSLNQTNAEYNYKYGTCLLFTDGDKAKALSHLVFAVNKNAALDKELTYYVAKAYHLNYRFAEAIKFYQKYATTAGPKEKEKYQIDRQIEMCNNGKRLLRNVTDLIVEEKKSYRELDFFRLYDLSKIGGKIIVVDDLQSSADKKKEHRPVVHLPKNSNVVYFSSYGDDNGTGKDIYRSTRLPGGSWSKPQIVNGPINTKYDEDYPYMHPDGRTFYFCSKGHNSMGGYDVFMCTYDANSETFGAPVNVDFAISTPDDDFLYIVDSLDQRAYFASKRESGTGKVNVYSVRVERIPVLTAIIKGRFVNEPKPDSKSTSISVTNTANGEMEALVNTKSSNGEYLIVLDKPGKYVFKVKDNNGQEHEQVVELPFLKELRPLKQEIVIVKDGLSEKIEIRNKFSESVDDADEIIAMVLKDKSSLNVNAGEIPQELIKDNDTGGIDARDFTNLTNQQLLDLAKEEIDNLNKEVKELKERSDAAYSIANQKLDESRTKAEQAEENIKMAANATDPLEKQQLLENATKLNNESQGLTNEAMTAFNVAGALEKDHQKAKTEADNSQKYYKGVQDALATNNKEEAIKKLREQQEFIKDIMTSDANKNDRAEEVRNEANTKRAESKKLIDNAQQMRTEESALIAKIDRLKREEKNAKGRDKEEIQQQIKETEQEASDMRDAIFRTYKKSENLAVEADQLEKEVDLIHSLEQGDIVTNKVLTEEEKKNLFNKINNNDVISQIENNRIKIDENTDQYRNERYDLNDYMARNEKYAQLLKEQNKYNTKSMTADEYNRYLGLQNKWISTIDDNISTLEKELKTTTDKDRQREIRKELNTLNDIKAIREKERKEVEANKDTIIRDDATSDNYDNKIQEIENSNMSDTRKEAEKAKTNKQSIIEDEKKIKDLKNKLAVSEGEEKETIKKELAIVEENKKIKEKKLQENNDNLQKKGVTNRVGNESYADISNTSDQAMNQSMEENKKKRNDLDDLKIERTETTDKKRQDELDKEIKKKETDLLKEEIVIGEKLADNNKKELTAANNTVDNKLNELNQKGFNNQEELKEIKNLQNDASNNQREATDLRNKAKNEKDDVKKNQLLKNAHDKEQEAVNQLNQAEKKIDNHLNKSVIPANRKEEVINRVSPDYNNTVKDINNNNSLSQEEKNNKKIEANNELIQDVEDRLDQIDNKLPTANGYEKEVLEKEKNELNVLKKDKEKENQNLKKNTADQTYNGNLEKEVMADYGNKKKEIENSNVSDVKKNQQLRELDEKFIADAENEIRKSEKEMAGLTPEEQKRRKMRIEELNRLMDAKKAELNIKDDELAKSGVTGRDPVKLNESSYESSTARTEAKNLTTLNQQIEKDRKELIDLQVKYAESTNEAEKTNLKKQIDTKTKALIDKENKLAAGLEKVNDAEFNDIKSKNDSRRTNVEKIDGVRSENYTEAVSVENSAIQKMKDADELRKQAAAEKDASKKRELLANALKKEQEAIREMRKAGTLFDIALTETIAENPNNANNTNNPNNRSNELTEENNRVTKELVPNYDQRKNEIDNSSVSETEKELKRNELNREVLAKAEKAINELQKDFYLLSPEEQKRRKMRIEELNRLMDQKKMELGISDAKLVSSGINSSSDRVPDTYVDPAVFNNKDAANLVAANKQNIAALQQEQKKLDALVAKMNAATTKEEQDKLLGEVEKQRNNVIKKENQLAPVFEKINNAEYNGRLNEIEELKKKFTSKADADVVAEIDKLVNEARALMDNAAAKRKEANATKDEKTKNALFREAFVLEQQALDKLKKAERLAEIEAGASTATNTVTDTQLQSDEQFISSIMPDYDRKLKEIQNAGNDSQTRKLWKQNELNKELLVAIDEKIKKLEEELKKAGIDEKEEKLNKLKQLNDLRNRKKAEIEANQKYLANNGLQSDDISYTDNYTLENSSARATKNEATTRIEDLQREERKLDDLIIKRKDATTDADRKKLDGEIKKQDQVVLKKENELAKTYETMHKAEIDAALTKVKSLQNAYKDKSDNETGNPDALKAESLLKMAEKHFSEAKELRALGDKEKDLVKKNQYYDNAYVNERKAINELHEAENIYEMLLPEIEIAMNRDPSYKDKKYNREIPALVEDRASTLEFNKANQLKQEADRLDARAVELTDSAQTVKKKNKQPLLDQAAQLRKKATDLRAEASMIEDRANALKKDEDEILAYQENKRKEAEEARIAEEKRREEEARNVNVAREDIINPNFRPPTEIKTQIFAKTDQPVYSAENPIPVDIDMPKGVYFKIQVGAFRNPIDQKTFNKFAPVNGERTPQGFIRYTVGYFTTFADAEQAKQEIRRMGYADAFIVGFEDGKRIPINNAVAKTNNLVADNQNGNNQNGNNQNGNNQNGNNQNGNNQNGNNQNGNNQNGNNQNGNNQNGNYADNRGTDNFVPDPTNANYYNKNDRNIAPANQTEIICGLFYTVQVGVYSKPVPARAIFNLSPLNTELTETKKIRYTTGIYTDVAPATNRKDEIRTIGVTDAFVTAYYNGKRITMEKARQLIAEKGNSVFTDPAKPCNGAPKNADNVNNNPPNNNNNQVDNNNPNNNRPPNNNLPTSGIYTVILGQYIGDVPAEDVEVFLANQRDYKIKKHKSTDGSSTYYVETENGMNTAKDIRDNFKLEGLNSAFIQVGAFKAPDGTVNEVQPKTTTGLKFQVYLGEYVDEVPADDAEIFLSNVDKNVKRKTTPQGYTIYYVCDCESYDDALKMKAHFVAEGITSVRVVPFKGDTEITMREAFKLIYE